MGAVTLGRLPHDEDLRGAPQTFSKLLHLRAIVNGQQICLEHEAGLCGWPLVGP